MWSFLNPPKPVESLSEDKIDPVYKELRLQVFLGIFIGYAGYYLVRKTFSMAMPHLQELGYSKTDLGLALSAVSIAYGLSKFFMGNVSDRSDARKTITIGLVLSALIMIFMGVSSWALSSVAIMFILLFINGWVQGMGWPPCGRVMVHWFSQSERGVKMSIWNVAHNVGGGIMAPLAVFGLTVFGIWEGKLILPGIIALIVAFVTWRLVRDTPQSCGLPPIEIYKKDASPNYSSKDEKEFSAKEIFVKYILNNKLLWMIAIANVFVYLVRYGVLDWAPLYLKEVKGMTLDASSWSYFAFEWAAIPGTLFCGWISDRLFAGRRAPTIIIFMALVLVAIIIYWQNPAGNPLVDNLSLIAIGFLVYGPVMLIGVQALDLVPKKAAGTAAGFTGMFGYLGGSVLASFILGLVMDKWSWDGGFYIIIVSCIIAIFASVLTLKEEIRRRKIKKELGD